jgi:mannose-6-phosphate isomerase-like protein (cupin superfamily)
MDTLLTSAPWQLQKKDSNLTIYSLVPVEAALGWTIELFELSRLIAPHYHKIRRQIIVAADDVLSVVIGNDEPLLLKTGELIIIEPGTIHSLSSKGTARFFSLDFPGFCFPDDVFHNIPNETTSWESFSNKLLQKLDSKYFGVKLDLGEYSVYEIANGAQSEQKWSLALLEIRNSPKHFHRIEKEIFIVVEGELVIIVDGESKRLKVGESIVIDPFKIHELKSGLQDPTRVLCFNFPAFDPKDMVLVD